MEARRKKKWIRLRKAFTTTGVRNIRTRFRVYSGWISIHGAHFLTDLKSNQTGLVIDRHFPVHD